jgi:Lrp/AsnC family transcriptional regulator of lysine biosynthesis
MKDIDDDILKELTINARKPFLQIAKKLKVSEGTIRKRVNKLHQNGVIKKFTIVRSNETYVIVGVQTNPQFPTTKIVQQISRYGVNRIFEVTGRFDAICLITTDTMEKTNEILEKIRTTEGIVHTETFTVLKET